MSTTVMSTTVMSTTQMSTAQMSPAQERKLAKEAARREAEQLDRDFLLPSLLIRDARRGKFIKFNLSDEKCVRSYAIYTNGVFTFLMKGFVCLLLCLVLIEEPAMPNVACPLWGTLTIEIVCLLFLIFRLVHRLKFSRSNTISKDARFIAAWVIISLMLIDIIVNLFWLQFAKSQFKLPRFTRMLRPILCMCFPVGTMVFKIVKNITRALPDVCALLAILVSGVSFFAIMTQKMFGPRELVYSDNTPYMVNFWDSWWDYYVLMTTANNPDVMLPAFDYSKWRALLFIIFLILIMYLFMNLTLATLYNNYKENLKEDVQLLVYRKRARLTKLFDLLKQWHTQLNDYVVTYDTWYKLISYTYSKMGEDMIKVYFLVLTDGEPYITKKNMLFLADLLNEPLEPAKKDPICCEKTCGKCYTSHPNEMFRKFIRSKWFRYIIDALIAANTITIALDYDKLEWVFLSIFTVEIILKVYTYGLMKFLSSTWNWLDTFIIAAALIVTLVLEVSGTGDKETRKMWLESILILRLLRLIRLLSIVNRFKIIFRTIVKVVPSLVAYSVVVTVVYYMFAILGMEIFKYKVTYHGYGEEMDNSTLYCGNPLLKDSEFFIKRYCSLNFNDFFTSVVLLFGQMVVNQWHVVTQGFEIVTSKAARLYFISFHIICVIVLMNIFTGVVLEVFEIEYAMRNKENLNNVVEKKIRRLGLAEDAKDIDDGEEMTSEKEPLLKKPQVQSIAQKYGLEDVRFVIKPSGARPTVAVLQAMFEGELDAADEEAAKKSSGQLTKKDMERLKLIEKAGID